VKKTEHIKRYEQGITSKFAVYSFPYVYDFSIYAIDIFYTDTGDHFFGSAKNTTLERFFTRKIYQDEMGYYFKYAQEKVYLNSFNPVKNNKLQLAQWASFIYVLQVKWPIISPFWEVNAKNISMINPVVLFNMNTFPLFEHSII